MLPMVILFGNHQKFTIFEVKVFCFLSFFSAAKDHFTVLSGCGISHPSLLSTPVAMTGHNMPYSGSRD